METVEQVLNAYEPVPNSSGQGELSVVPDELKGWNWGAFAYSWIWGLAHDTYVAMLAILPVFNIIMPIVLGIKGNEWAWRNKKWDSIAHFKRVQRNWAIASIILLVIFLVVLGTVVNSTLTSLNQINQTY
jgi:hypothetical protein